MNDTVGSDDISGRDGGAFDAQGAVGEANHRIVSVHHPEFCFVGHVGPVDGSVVHVVEQDVPEGLLAFGGVEGRQVNVGGCKRIIGWSKDGEGPLAAKRFGQLGLHQCRKQRGVDVRASSGRCDVVWRVGWCKHRIDDVDNAVAGHRIGGGHDGVVHHDGVRHAERQRLTVHGRRCHAVFDVRSKNRPGHHVVPEEVGKCVLSFGRVVVAEVDVCVGEGLVGRSEHRERTVALQGFNQFGLHQGGHEGGVVPRALGGTRQIVWGHRWAAENRVDDVNHTVAGHRVGLGDGGSVHLCFVADAERHREIVGGLNGRAVRQVGCKDNPRNDVGEENF